MRPGTWIKAATSRLLPAPTCQAGQSLGSSAFHHGFFSMAAAPLAG